MLSKAFFPNDLLIAHLWAAFGLARLIHDFRRDCWNISGMREGARRRCGFFCR